jgi:polar amino acid transport system substrate-binding protein
MQKTDSVTKLARVGVSATIAIAALISVPSPSFAGGAAAAQLPASIKKSGVINVGTDTTYGPNEYLDAKGKPIGWEIDLFNAIAADLGVKVRYVIAGFDTIIPGIKGGKYDAGVSSFTDTKVREAQVDFANYYTAGIQWASAAGKAPVDPNNACGLTVSVQTGTTEVDDIKAKSALCTKAGKKAITILSFDDQNQVNNSVSLGRASAISADSPITEYAVLRSGGKLQLAGPIYGNAPYGIATAKGSTLAKAVSLAFQDIYKNGTYAKVLAKWGVTAGGVKSFAINGATS